MNFFSDLSIGFLLIRIVISIHLEINKIKQIFLKVNF